MFFKFTRMSTASSCREEAMEALSKTGKKILNNKNMKP
jgi:hypothetical protein